MTRKKKTKGQMKRDDNAKLISVARIASARYERDKAEQRKDILLRGTGACLSTGYFESMEEFMPILELINGQLVDAIKEAEAASEKFSAALGPYRRRRRSAMGRPRKRTKAGHDA